MVNFQKKVFPHISLVIGIKNPQMKKRSHEEVIQDIATIIHNHPLASAIHESVELALRCPNVHTYKGISVWDIFKQSLDTAIRDIENHPRGKLFRRLIEYGPHHPDDPESLVSDGERTLSDPECGECVQFIFSHMINRFKGELAELLSIKPCLDLVKQLQNEGQLPSNAHLYMGDVIQERRRARKTRGNSNVKQGNFAKGADGLIVEPTTSQYDDSKDSLTIRGVIEVKSMSVSAKKIIGQINSHISRLEGGLKLAGTIWPPDRLGISDVFRIIVTPSTWKLNREWHSIKTDQGRKIVLSEPPESPLKTRVEKIQNKTWKIMLAGSEELLNQSAYEMTFWYMSQVGKHIYAQKSLPKEWKDMTAEEAGYNSIKKLPYILVLNGEMRPPQVPYRFNGIQSIVKIWMERFFKEF